MTPLSGSEWFHSVLVGGRERPYSSETEFVGEAGVVAVSGEMDLSECHGGVTSTSRGLVERRARL